MSDLLLAPRRDSLVHAALGSRNFVIGAAITAVFALGALVSLFWTPYPPARSSSRTSSSSPASAASSSRASTSATSSWSNPW